MNLLPKFSASSTKRHWNGVKHALRYLKSTKDPGLYFESNRNVTLPGYSNVGNMSDPHNANPIGYFFLCGDTTMS